jgi:hypothetical protein
VTIYVHWSDFDAMENNATVPGHCAPVGEGQTVAYTFDVPCEFEAGSAACEATPELTCEDFASQIISSEDFEMSEQAQSWLFTGTGVDSRLGLSADSPEVSKTFEVPMDSSKITLEFDSYENDDWKNDDEVFIRINDVYLDLISYISGTREGIKTGTFGELAAAITTSESNHSVRLTISDTWYLDGRLTLGFKVSTSVAETIGFDNVVLSSACAAGLAVSSLVVCPIDGGDMEISFEDFEHGEVDSNKSSEAESASFISNPRVATNRFASSSKLPMDIFLERRVACGNHGAATRRDYGANEKCWSHVGKSRQRAFISSHSQVTLRK